MPAVLGLAALAAYALHRWRPDHVRARRVRAKVRAERVGGNSDCQYGTTGACSRQRRTLLRLMRRTLGNVHP